MLGYYRNPLNHIFFNEGLIIASMYSYGQDAAWKEGVNAEEVYKKALFLGDLLFREEVVQQRICTGPNS
jgi:hypothetical protein